MADAVRSMKDSMVLPNWAGKLFGALLIVIFLVLGYSVNQVSHIQDREQTAYNKGEDEAIAHFRAFFEANPEAGALNKKWTTPENKK